MLEKAAIFACSFSPEFKIYQTHVNRLLWAFSRDPWGVPFPGLCY